MGQINVQSAVINTHLFFILFIFNIYFFFHQCKVVHIHLWNCFHKFTYFLCCCFYFMGSINHFGLWYCIEIYSTQNFWGVCVTRWKYDHLIITYFHLTHLILLWIFHQCIISKLQLKLFNHIIHFSYVLADFPVSVNGVSAAFTQFIIAWFGELYYLFCCDIFMTLSLFHIKSSLCVGDLVTHHTSHIRVTHFRWPAL